MDEPHSRVSLLAEEIADQPEAWRRAIEIGSGEPNPLAAPGRIAVIGCGSSWHAAKAIAALREAAAAALEAPLALDPAELDRAVFLATGPRVGLADAAALMLRETAQFWAESYPAMEYRHGPISTAGPGAAVWFLDPPPEGLAAEVAATGATAVDALGDPLAELVRVQRLALAIAERRGLDPDNPPHLTRAIVL